VFEKPKKAMDCPDPSCPGKSTKMEMGFIEAYEKKAQGKVFSMCRLQGPIDKQLLGKAIFCLYRKNPMLRARYAKAGLFKEYFEIDPPREDIPIEVVKRENDDQWKDIVDAYLNGPFSEEEPFLWKAVLLEGGPSEDGIHEILFLSHHSIVDGLSSIAFFKEILSYMKSLIRREEIRIDAYAPLPHVGKLLTDKVTGFNFWKINILNLLKGYRHRKYFWQVEKYVPLEKRRVKNITLQIGKTDATLLTREVEERDLSITALFVAVLIAATNKAMHMDTDREKVQIGTVTVNLRKNCRPKIPNHRLGLYIKFLACFIRERKQADLWDIAHSYMKTFRENFHRRDQHYIVADNNRLNPSLFAFSIHHFFLKNRFPGGIAVSNVGVNLFGSLYEPFRVQCIYGGGLPKSGDWLMLLSCINTDGNMNLSFCFIDPLLQEKTARSIVSEFMEIIHSVISISGNKEKSDRE
jgi:hypothetical protein